MPPPSLPRTDPHGRYAGEDDAGCRLCRERRERDDPPGISDQEDRSHEVGSTTAVTVADRCLSVVVAWALAMSVVVLHAGLIFADVATPPILRPGVVHSDKLDRCSCLFSEPPTAKRCTTVGCDSR